MTTARTIPAALFIAGAWVKPTSGTCLDVRNPADGSLVGSVGYGGKVEALAAVEAAQAAFPAWAALPARAPPPLLLRVSEMLQERAERIGYLLALETGKRLPEAVGEIRFGAEYFRWFAEQARRPEGERFPHEAQGRRHFSVARPCGVALCLTPWNFPISIQARKLAPALAAGCTVVARASEKAPLAVIELFRCLEEAGLPAGVANLIAGPAGETTHAMLAHPAVRVVSFTGSTEVGREVMRAAAEHIVRPLLELGGNAPFIVCEDANLERAVEGAMLAKFRNNGQSCIAANRFLVHEAVYDEFVQRFAARVDHMSLGNPVQEPLPDLGPLIDNKRKQAVEAIVAQAEEAGARRVTSVPALPVSGTFAAPALLVDVPAHTSLAREEVFGPIAGIFPFASEQEALARANATEMGLAAYLYTENLSRAWRMAEALEAGILGLNNALPSVAYAPMGGMKQSGLGREGARQGLEEFQETSYLSLELEV